MHIIISGKWVFYAMAADTFPLTDSPVLTSPTTIMIALSPRLMLEVYRYLRSPKPWEVRRSIKPSKLAEFRRRTIANASKEIIFSERGLLDSWRSLPEFQRQRTLLDREKTAAPYSLIKTDPAFFASQ
jgi:tRNA(His) 5'-end guanylyltransferase